MSICKSLIIIIMTISSAALSAFGQIDNSTLMSCSRLIVAIRERMDGIERTLNDLSALARLSEKGERDKIRELKQKYTRERNDLEQKYFLLTDKIDLSCEKCIEKECLPLRSGLGEINDQVVKDFKALLVLVAEIRKEIATVKRIRSAISATDEALLKATKKFRKGKNEFALGELRAAVHFQEEAHNALDSNQPDSAMKATFLARDIIGKTLNSAIDSADAVAIREQVTDFLKETDRLIKTFKRIADKDHIQELDTMIRAVELEQKKAYDNLMDSPYIAMRHAQSGRRIIDQIKYVLKRRMFLKL